MAKKKGKGLPKELLNVPNPDKAFHEKWQQGRDMLDIPHPYRAVCLGPPHSGKTCVVKNLLLRANPPFKEVFIIHCDPNYTKEYDDVQGQLLDEIPAPEDWEGKNKTLVVLDDLEFKGMNKDQKRNLDRLFGFVSTHKNISCVLCSQDPFNVPAIVRRCSNLWILWRMLDVDALATVARRTGMKSENFNSIFNNLMLQPRDSLWLDMTDNSPFPMRKNGYIKIERAVTSPVEESKKADDK